MTEVSKNTRTSLSTITSVDNFFYLTKNDYISDSIIYILFEDDGFSLRTSSISICLTYTNPNSPPKSVLMNCSTFDGIPLY